MTLSRTFSITNQSSSAHLHLLIQMLIPEDYHSHTLVNGRSAQICTSGWIKKQQTMIRITTLPPSPPFLCCLWQSWTKWLNFKFWKILSNSGILVTPTSNGKDRWKRDWGRTSGTLKPWEIVHDFQAQNQLHALSTRLVSTMILGSLKYIMLSLPTLAAAAPWSDQQYVTWEKLPKSVPPTALLREVSW